jgi:hypothetical protein
MIPFLYARRQVDATAVIAKSTSDEYIGQHVIARSESDEAIPTMVTACA